MLFLQIVINFISFSVFDNMVKKSTKSKCASQTQQKPMSKMFTYRIRDHIKRKLKSKKVSSSNIYSQILSEFKIQHAKKSDPLKQIISSQGFGCPICYELMIFPVTLSCTHSFCKPCIENATMYQNKCSYCRNNIQEEYFTTSTFLEELINNYIVEGFDKQRKNQYRIRQEKYYLWENYTMIDPYFKIGEYIHFQVNKEGWRYGVIKQAHVKANSSVYLTINPLICNKRRQSYKINLLSKKIARFDFYQSGDNKQGYNYLQIKYDQKHKGFTKKEQYYQHVMNQRIQNRSYYENMQQSQASDMYQLLNTTDLSYVNKQLLEQYKGKKLYTFQNFLANFQKTAGKLFDFSLYLDTKFEEKRQRRQLIIREQTSMENYDKEEQLS